MPEKILLYHGSQKIIERPRLAAGKSRNDYGPGLYCTENLALAKEWACTADRGGFANQYRLDLTGLRLLTFSRQGTHVLNWVALLLKNRMFCPPGDWAVKAGEYLLDEFLLDFRPYDVLQGCRADDSYFSFAAAFLQNRLSLEQLSQATRLDKWNRQTVLVSEKAFAHLTFTGYDQAQQSVYYGKRLARDAAIRAAVQTGQRMDRVHGTYLLDILKEGWKNDDPRLRGNLSE
jgi:hypothetical protein